MAKYQKNSFLRNAVSLNEKFLDVTNLPKIRESVYDEDYTIDIDVDERPDLLAFKIYGDSNLWWVFAQRNIDLLKDPVYDLVPGIKIYLPKGDALARQLGF